MVCIVAAPQLGEVARVVADGLSHQGFEARVGVPGPGDTAVVVVLGEHLPGGLQELAAGGARLVPVTVGNVPEAWVPPEIRALNWIPWDETRRDEVTDVIARACGTDVATFQAMQSLEARAAGWAMGGERPEDLTDTPTARRELDLTIARGEQLSPLVLRYARLSRQAVRATSRRTWLRRGLWSLLAAVLVVGGFQIFRALAAHQERSKLLLVATSVQDDLAPYAQIPKFAALVRMSDERGETPPLDAEARLSRLLSAPGPAQLLTLAPNGMFINAVAFGTEDAMLLASGDGTLWRGTVGQLGLDQLTTARHGVVQMAADEALTRWVVGDGSSLTFGGSTGSATLTSGIGDGFEYLQMQRDGRIALAWDGANGEAYSTGGEARKIRDLPGMVGAGEVDGRLRVVLQHGDLLSVVDAESGDELSRLAAPGGVTSATITADGTLAAVTGQRLWLGRGDTLVDSGIPVPTSLLDLRAVAGSEVLLTTIGDGAQLIDVAHRRLVSEVRDQGALPFDVRVAPAGRWVACGNSGVISLVDLDELRPLPAAGSGADGSRSETAGTAARIVEGRLELSRDNVDVLLDPSGTAPDGGQTPIEAGLGIRGGLTAVALSQDGRALAYGSDMGEVVVADLTSDLKVLATARWERQGWGPVTGLAFEAGAVSITTGDVSWRVDACVGCRLDRGLLWETFEARRLPCYLSNFDDVLPRRIARELGLETCWAGE